jgi:hypothetical protein
MAVAGAVFTSRQAVYEARFLEAGAASGHVARRAIPPAFHDALLISGILGILVILVCIFSKQRKDTGNPGRIP